MKTFLFFKLNNEGQLHNVVAYQDRENREVWHASLPLAWLPLFDREGNPIFRDHLVQCKTVPVYIVPCPDCGTNPLYCETVRPEVCVCGCHDPNAPKEWRIQL